MQMVELPDLEVCQLHIKIITVAIASTISYNLMLGTYNVLLTSSIQRVTALNLVESNQMQTTAIGNTLISVWNGLLGGLMWLTAQFTRNFNVQVKAQERLNLVTKANPWGALIIYFSCCRCCNVIIQRRIRKDCQYSKTV